MSDLVDPALEQTGGRPAAEATGVEVIDAEDRVRPTGLFVAGVGRSGTSIATRLAMSLGLRGPQPEDVMPANAANPTGYWESNSLAIVNDDLLGRLGATWWTPPAELSDADLAQLAPNGAAAAQAFEAAFGPGPGWVWKDPRLTVLLRFWSKILGDQPILLPTRSPQAVALSISARDGIPYGSALDIWDRHTRCLLTSLTGRRVLVVQYESLLDDPQAWVHDVYDFARSSGLPVAELDGLPELVAPRPQDDASLPPAQQRLYDLVRDLTGVHASFPPLDLPPAGEATGPPIELDRVVAHSAPQSASAQLSAMAAGLAEEREMIQADHDRIVAERSVLTAEPDHGHEQLRNADSASYDAKHYPAEYIELMKTLVATRRLRDAAPS